MGAIYLGQKCKLVLESLFVMPAFLQQRVQIKQHFYDTNDVLSLFLT
jgi:hypothetical protein